MPSIAVRNIQSKHIEIMPKSYCYKLKYTTPHLTLLSIYLYTPHIEWDTENGMIKLILNDSTNIQSLKEIDNTCMNQITNYRPFMKHSNQQWYLLFSPNPEVLKLYNSKPRSVHLYLKTIQKKTDLNIPVMYIINHE